MDTGKRRPKGFVIASTYHPSTDFTMGKIYPYYETVDYDKNGDLLIEIKNNCGKMDHRWMFIDLKPTNGHAFDFFTPPEFPKDVLTWTEDDWFNFSLKYGE